MKITLEKINPWSHKLIFDGKKSVGTLDMQDNGFFTFNGFDAWALREIADRLDEVNKPLDESIHKYFYKSVMDSIEKHVMKEIDFIQEAELEYEGLMKTGMMWEWYPQLSGNWEKDKEEWLIHYEKLLESRLKGKSL